MLLVGLALGSTACSGGNNVSLNAGATSLSTGATAATGSAVESLPSSKVQAEAVAQRLVRLVVVPAGAVKIPASSALVSGPLTTDNDPQQVDVGQSYRVRMPFSQAMAFLSEHPPAGLTKSAWSSGQFAVSEPTGGIQYFEAVSGGQIQVEAASHGGLSTDLRADAVVSWRNPDAAVVRDTTPEPRIRVTVSGGCPASNDSAVGVTNSGSGLSTGLAPPGTPSAALVCAYAGLAGLRSAPALRDDAGAAEQLAAAIRAVPLLRAGDVFSVVNCPAETGAHDILVLSFPDRADIDVTTHPGGAPCGGSANGVVEGSGGVSFPTGQ